LPVVPLVSICTAVPAGTSRRDPGPGFARAPINDADAGVAPHGDADRLELVEHCEQLGHGPCVVVGHDRRRTKRAQIGEELVDALLRVHGDDRAVGAEQADDHRDVLGPRAQQACDRRPWAEARREEQRVELRADRGQLAPTCSSDGGTRSRAPLDRSPGLP